MTTLLSPELQHLLHGEGAVQHPEGPMHPPIKMQASHVAPFLTPDCRPPTRWC
jgi:hypothetical protein